MEYQFYRMLKTACDCLKKYIGTDPVIYKIPKFSTGSDRSLAFYLALDEEVFRSIIWGEQRNSFQAIQSDYKYGDSVISFIQES